MKTNCSSVKFAVAAQGGRAALEITGKTASAPAGKALKYQVRARGLIFTSLCRHKGELLMNEHLGSPGIHSQ